MESENSAQNPRKELNIFSIVMLYFYFAIIKINQYFGEETSFSKFQAQLFIVWLVALPFFSVFLVIVPIWGFHPKPLHGIISFVPIGLIVLAIVNKTVETKLSYFHSWREQLSIKTKNKINIMLVVFFIIYISCTIFLLVCARNYFFKINS